MKLLIANFIIIFSLTILSAKKPPNIVIMLMDDLGYADIGAFGTKAYPTPHLDKMAKEGRKFTDFYVTQAVCSASRAGLLTGCYNVRIGINGALGPKSNIGLNPHEITIAEICKQRGYATACFGKCIWVIIKNFCQNNMGLMNISASPTPMTCGLPSRRASFADGRKAQKMALPTFN